MSYESKLGSQAVLPKCIPMTASEWQKASTLPAVRVIYGKVMDFPLRGLTLQTKLLGKPREPLAPFTDMPSDQVSRLSLFKFNMSADGSLDAHISHKGNPTYFDAEMGIYCAYKGPFSDALEYHQLPVESRNYDLVDTVITLESEIADARFVELGFYCSGSLEVLQPATLRQISNITIKPKEHPSVKPIAWNIVNPHVIEKGHAGHRQKRLAWELQARNEQGSKSVEGLPWSVTTGPFSYFIVSTQRRELGRAYCTEFCLHEADFGEPDEDEADVEVEVIVRGILFGGGDVRSDPVRISLDWVVL
jgi:hypothetical protein